MTYINPTRIDSISVALGGVAATQALPLFQESIKIPVLPVVLAAALSLIVFHVVKLFLKRLPMKFAFTRRLIDAKSKFEGFYLETKNTPPEETYSIFSISYDVAYNQYVISGIGVENGGIAFQWKSTVVFIDIKSRKISYSTEGRATIKGVAQNFEGVTFLNFDFQSKYPDFGLGHFIDSLPAFADFTFKRINEEDCLKHISKKKLKEAKDYITYIEKYKDELKLKSFAT